MKKVVLIIICLFLFINYLSAQNKYEKIDSILNSNYKLGNFNGTALVSEKGNPILVKGYGHSNFELETFNNPQSKFLIGSCSKQFTAALVMILIEQGKISLGEKITKYIPDYPAEKGNKINIHHLLSHTSGIPEYYFILLNKELVFKKNEPTEFIKNFWDLDLDFEPGSELKYSNSGFFLLGVIIEEVTGLSYDECLDKYIFNPLSMKGSGVLKGNEILKNKSYGYIKSNDTLKVAPYYHPSGAFSAGAIYSTVEDLLKWQNALFFNTILSKESMDKMLTVNFSRYGYGFGVLEKTLGNGQKITLFGHEGLFFGYRSLIHFVKEDNNSIILLDNNENPNLFSISTEIRKVMYLN